MSTRKVVVGRICDRRSSGEDIEEGCSSRRTVKPLRNEELNQTLRDSWWKRWTT